jgi:hypothetical protein
MGTLPSASRQPDSSTLQPNTTELADLFMLLTWKSRERMTTDQTRLYGGSAVRSVNAAPCRSDRRA